MLITNDYDEMIAAADEWGEPNDESRRHFLAGWRDEIDGFTNNNRPKGGYDTADVCAYNSGVCAAKEFSNATKGERHGPSRLSLH